MSSQRQAGSGGIGFAGLLTIVFITLKLTHFIDWSWWWVLSPMWGPIAFVLLLTVAALVIWVLAKAFMAAFT